MLPWALALLSVLVAVAPTHGTPLSHKETSATREDTQEYRLPKSVAPLAYGIRIIPDINESGQLNTTGFSGCVFIIAQVEKQLSANDKIVLHKGANIRIKWGLLVSQNGSDTIINGQEYNNETEKMSISLREDFNVGEIVNIIMCYEAEFTEDGLTPAYINSHSINKDQSALLTTNFKPTHARKAFPCFDEPEYMAHFVLLIDINDNVDAISNMESFCAPSRTTNCEPTDARKAFPYFDEPKHMENFTLLHDLNDYLQYVEKFCDDECVKVFLPSPKMSTYHLAFTIYENKYFGKIEESTQTGNMLPFRIWSSIGSNKRENLVQEDSKELVLVEGPAALYFMGKYTGITYMSKMDVVAIPGVQSGTLEDWGFITSGDPFNEQTDTSETFERVVDEIDNVLAHMWFGNLVTANWWSSIWLNEGFARYMQYLAENSRYPDWRMLERFVLDEQMGVFGVDATADAAPLTDENVLSPTQIENHFSAISYSKGAAILRQISNVMGEGNFREGIQQFLKQHSRQSVTPADLFEILKSFHKTEITNLENGIEFVSVLEDWTTKPGYPLVTVTQTGKNISVSQERFLLDLEEESDPILYPVCLTWITSRDSSSVNAPKAPQKWLKASDTSIQFTIEGIYSKDWVLFNAYQGGYYRVNYDDATWKRITTDLDAGHLELAAALDRAALVDNAMAVARAQKLSYNIALRLLRFLRHDTAFEPWAAARTALAHLQRMLGDQNQFKDFVAFIVEKAYNATGFDGLSDAHVETVHRTNVLTLACSAGYERCLEEAKELLDKYLVEEEENEENGLFGEIRTTPVHPDLESVVFCYGLKGASPETWEKLWGEYAESDAARRSMLINALGCIDHRETLKEFLLKSLDPKEVQDAQDAHKIFSSVSANLDGGAQVALDFLTFWGYEKLKQRYGDVKDSMSILISGLAETLTTEAQKNQLAVALPGSTSSHEAALKIVQRNIDWMKTHRTSVLMALDEARTNTSAGVRSLSTPILLIIFTVVAFGVH